MCYLYVLSDSQRKRYYIGSTNNLNRRIIQHRKGYTRTTRILNTNDIIYTEKYDDINLARNREKKLKSYKSHKYISWLIKNKSTGP